MKIAPKSKRWAFGSCGMLLLLAGCYAVYFWHYEYAPVRRLYNGNWFRLHSPKAAWLECQKSVGRGEWYHDAGFSIGRFGDKTWAAVLVAQAEAGDGCGQGHPIAGLRLLSNQEAGLEGDAWGSWWKTNETKLQEDWIREGFRLQGIDLESPLSKSNVVALLTLIDGQPLTGTNTPPTYLQYNAFRWLRDSDFDPARFSVSDLPSTNANIVLHGLVKYSKRIGQLPKDLGLGVLPLGESPRAYDGYRTALINQPWFHVVANAVIVALLIAGLMLIRLAVRVGRAAG